MNGTINEVIKAMNNKLEVIKELKFSTGIKLPIKILVWKFWLGKNKSPSKSPDIIAVEAILLFIFLLKKP